MAMLDVRVSGDEEQDVRVAVFIKEGELIICNEWVCEWKERTEGERQAGGVSYSPPGWTLHVSTPTRLSRSLL